MKRDKEHVRYHTEMAPLTLDGVLPEKVGDHLDLAFVEDALDG